MKDRYDVIVIGGGVIGLCCAYYIRQTGASVAVVDKSDLSDGASWVNAGLLVPSHIDPIAAPGVIAQGLKWLANPESPFYIKPRIDMDLTRWLWGFQAACTEDNVKRAVPVLRDLAFASIDLHGELAELPEFSETGFSRSGLMMLHNSSKSETANLALAELAQEAGLDVAALDRTETLELEPAIRTPMNGSVLFREDSCLDPEAFMQALLTRLEVDGVDLLSDTAVESFERTNGTIEAVSTGEARLSADHFVLSAGSWSGILAKKLQLNLPIQPATGYSITVEGAGSELKIPVIVTDEKVTVTPVNGKIRIGGTLTLVGFDTDIPEKRTRPLQRQARLYCADYRSDDIALPATRSGFRPCTTDGLPAIGRADKLQNLVIATGHGMLGVTQGPITGRIVSNLLEGLPPPIDLSEIDPNRF